MNAYEQIVTLAEKHVPADGDAWQRLKVNVYSWNSTWEIECIYMPSEGMAERFYFYANSLVEAEAAAIEKLSQPWSGWGLMRVTSFRGLTGERQPLKKRVER